MNKPDQIDSQVRLRASWAAYCIAFTVLVRSAQLSATPPGDPICASPSSIAVVSALRAQLSATTGWGDQSWMEMFVGYIDFTLSL